MSLLQIQQPVRSFRSFILGSRDGRNIFSYGERRLSRSTQLAELRQPSYVSMPQSGYWSAKNSAKQDATGHRERPKICTVSSLFSSALSVATFDNQKTHTT